MLQHFILFWLLFFILEAFSKIALKNIPLDLTVSYDSTKTPMIKNDKNKLILLSIKLNGNSASPS